MLRAQSSRSLCWLRQVISGRPPPVIICVQNRRFGLSSPANSSEPSPDVKEVEIPVPWGKIAARHWNCKPGAKPVLCVHGWKDNAASFDTLLPLLVKESPQHQFLAIDLPGHGRSSHFPPGMVYLWPDIFLLYRRIFRHFGWDKVSIIAHSMGAHFSFMFSGTHPKIVEKFIAIDALSPFVQTKKDNIELIPRLTLEMLGFEDKLEKGVRPTYTYDEILQKLLKTHVGRMNPEACEILMTRGMEECSPGSGRYRFTHDIRVHYMPIQGVSGRQVADVMQNFRSDILVIKAEQGFMFTVKYIEDNQQKWLAYDTANKPKGNIVTFVTVPGNHHIHLMDPQSILPHVARFLSQSRFAVYDGS